LEFGLLEYIYLLSDCQCKQFHMLSMFLFALPIQILFSIFISVHFALSTVNPPPISVHTRPADAAQINQIKVELFDSLSALLAEFSGFAVAAGRKSEENAIQ